MTHLHRHKRSAGFTLIELLVGTAVLGTLVGITWTLSAGEVRREEVNSLAIELATWLKTVQSTAQVRPGSTATTLANGCTVTFTGAATTGIGTLIAPGAVLATVTPAECSPDGAFAVPSGSSSTRRFRVTIAGGVGADTNQVVFTPRSTVTAANNVTLRLRLQDSALTRCVRVGATLGQISIGANNNDNQLAGTFCDEGSYGGRF